MTSRKKFNEAAKRLKRKQFLTAAEARDELARKEGYRNFAWMEQAMIERGEWK
ncbi:hypothetical protein [Marinobacter nauticus]|uniref:Uncharacterized protein n=1 Tax=Marinobacter nauticus TaxID=2743 RepID=A0A833JR51_MARNT|nr:hypothetical protein [Marinobacter nauticus]KAE8546178.1 hypothetical protein F6453_1424 [Marinobacter nauticus]